MNIFASVSLLVLLFICIIQTFVTAGPVEHSVDIKELNKPESLKKLEEAENHNRPKDEQIYVHKITKVLRDEVAEPYIVFNMEVSVGSKDGPHMDMPVNIAVGKKDRTHIDTPKNTA